MATPEQQKKTQKAMINAKAIAKQNAIPARIGVQKGEGKLVHGKVQKVKAPKDREKAEIKRNTSKQIISYTRDSKSEYGVVKLDGVRSEYVRDEYHRTFRDRPEQFTRDTVDKQFSPSVIKNLNAMSFELQAGVVEEEEIQENPLQFTGEIIRVGSDSSAYFYIEDGKFYTVGPLFNFLAEKLGKPLGMRINDDYDYQGKYKPAGKEQLDMGQNQYPIYNKETYTRDSIAYVESNAFGGALTKAMIMGSQKAADGVIQINLQLKTQGKYTDGGIRADFKEIHIKGNDSTPVRWDEFMDRPHRTLITSTDSSLKVVDVGYLSLNHSKFEGLEFKLSYHGGLPPVILDKASNAVTGYEGKSDRFSRTYIIGKDLITKDLHRIDITQRKSYLPFGVKGEPNEYKWENQTPVILPTKALSAVSGLRKRVNLSSKSIRSIGGRKIICNELYRQGYLSEKMWDADERYGDMMFEKDPKMIIGYQMWARKVVKYMKNNPNNTKMAYWLFKPWTEYMGYEMGIVEKPTLRGRFTHWVGKQISYITFNLFGGQYLLNKYNKLKLDN